MKFFIGWHQPNNGESGCYHFDRCMISVNRLLRRESAFKVKDWILDSGAFTRITSRKGHLSTRKYAKEIIRWKGNGNLMAAVTQDYMCEPFVLGITGLTVTDHQRLTIHRYDRLLEEMGRIDLNHPYLMPVLQGFTPSEYLTHIDQYRDRLKFGMWVGVGSVCKRNANPSAIEAVLLAIKQKRPDLKLHGFGIKKTALSSGLVRDLLYSADSQAHSFSGEHGKGGDKFSNANNPLAAKQYSRIVMQSPVQGNLFTWTGNIVGFDIS